MDVVGLEARRKQIDEIDQRLVSLLEERLEVSLAIGRFKKEAGLQILDRKREEEVVLKNLGRLKNPVYNPYIRTLMEMLMSVSRESQRDIIVDQETTLEELVGDVPVTPILPNPRVAYGGIQGSFGEEALIRYFGEVQAMSFQGFQEVVAAVLQGSVDYGVLPMENTSTGGILEVERLLESEKVYIVGEVVVPVEHCLLGLGTLDQIKTVYSHVQGFEQSRDFLNEKGYQEIPYFNTAISARYVAEKQDQTLGAIASRRAAAVYGLKVLAENINYNQDNFTRFIVVKRSLELDGKRDKISVQVILEDQEGSLYKVIRSVTQHRLNMVKIASRPIIGRPFEYIFSIDFNGNIEDVKVKKALLEIRENSLEMYFKGNYKEVKRREHGE